MKEVDDTQKTAAASLADQATSGEESPQLFTERVVVARDYEQNWSIELNPGMNENRPTYFILCDHVHYEEVTKCARISFLEPKYVTETGEKAPWRLINHEEKKRLMNFLNSHRRGKADTEQTLSNWQYAIALWNVEMGFIDSPEEAMAWTSDRCSPHDVLSPLPIDLPMPDYLQLP